MTAPENPKGAADRAARWAEVEARWEAATKGPWQMMPGARSNLAHVETGEGCPLGQGIAVCSVPKKRIADAVAMAAAPEDIAYLLAELRALAAEVGRYREALEACAAECRNLETPSSTVRHRVQRGAETALAPAPSDGDPR